MKETIARPYSEAVFAQADKESSIDSWSEALVFLNTLISDEQVQTLIGSPSHSDAQVQDVLLSVASDLSETQQNFIKLLVQNKRLDVVSEIASQYEALRAQHENRVQVEVTSAYALSDSEIAEISKSLETKLSSKVDIKTAVDEDLVGGVVIRAGDMVIDTSVRGQVEQFSQSLIN